MKVKNLYYRTVFKRTNAIKAAFLFFFLAICSWPRVFIENFTRKNFGERYFNFPLCLFLAGLLIAYPMLRDRNLSFLSAVSNHMLWYAYVTVFLIFSYKRYQEVKREPGTYDFEKFSLSPGLIHPLFYDLEQFGLNVTNRISAIYLEPGIFFFAGILLGILKQEIGYLFFYSSIIYSFSWSAQYYLGDQFILDTIDEMISNENLTESFVHNRPPKETKGFEVYGQKPGSIGFRRKIADSIIEEEPAVDVL